MRLILATLLLFAHFATASELDLFAYLSANVADASHDSSIPAYDRLHQFGAWAHQDGGRACLNTREAVLERNEDPSVTVQTSHGGCTITQGEWHDPYTGQTFTEAKEIQIDHLVPLKNAYYAGAYAWSAQLRCNYANFLANDYHLQAVSGHENMAKGDRGPDGYMPPNAEERCTYLAAWMRIKMIWQLTSTQAEVSAIGQMLSSCPEGARKMESSDLARQRAAANTPIASCAGFGGAMLSE